jgi:hypothetical protein
MSTPEHGSSVSRSNHPTYVIRYTCDGEGDKFAEGVARRRTRSSAAGGEPKLEVAYDRSRHVIQITQEGGETAEFEDRPARFLLMDRDPETGKMKPAMEWGCPVFYHLTREVEGGAPGM